MFSVVRSGLLVGQGACPNGAEGLSFRHDTLKGDDLLSWGHRCCGSVFLRQVLDFKGRYLEYRDSISIKAPVYGGDFSLQMIRRQIHTTSEKEVQSVSVKQ